jgi:HK97 family phage major capsid protein
MDATAQIPFIIGDLKEGVKKFDRKQLTLLTSNTAAVGQVNAFEQDLTIFRGIMRADYKVRDADAFVNGYITA